MYMCASLYRQHLKSKDFCLCSHNETQILLKHVNKPVYSEHVVSVNGNPLLEDSTKTGQFPEFQGK